MDNIILNREEFYDEFIYPLECEFGFKTYWNSKNLEELGLKQISSNCNGTSFTSRVNCPIVLRYRQNSYNMFRTLIHEYAHSYLHGKYNNPYGYSLNSPIQEVEAESVAKKVFEKLGLEYLNGWYIPKYLKKCKQEDLDKYDKDTREKEIASLVHKIVDIFNDEDYIKFINSLNKENVKKIHKSEDIKYTVTCPCCNTVWEYKRKVDIIKTNAKGYWCVSCGEEKTKDKFIVKAL